MHPIATGATLVGSAVGGDGRQSSCASFAPDFRFRVKAKADPPPSVAGVAVSFRRESRSCPVRPRVIRPERSSALWSFEPAAL